MAIMNIDSTVNAASGFNSLSPIRQVMLLVGLSASIAVGFLIYEWTKEPHYQPLYSHLGLNDSSEVVKVLQRNGIPYKLDMANQSILVAAGHVYDARMKLASEGLPNGTSSGFELLDKQSSFGASQFMEKVRYRRGLEGELSRTIASFKNVKSARVHLAIPRQSVFVKDRNKAAASVLLTVYSGHKLERSQINAISNLVASSVPGLQHQNVTVVDQFGNLLNSNQGDDAMAMADKQLTHTREVEARYKKHIEAVITPLLGPGKVRASVVADIDYTHIEYTKESFNPDMPAVRSEQSLKESDSSDAIRGGVAGAAGNRARSADNQNTSEDITHNGRVQITKNYELDKTISHTQHNPGTIRRLSVSVVVDDVTSVSKKGKISYTPLTAEQMQRITSLVKSAIGFNPQRGDTVNVMNMSFNREPPVEEIPEPAIWEQAWFLSLIQQVLAVGLLLGLAFGVLRPVLKQIVVRAPAPPQPKLPEPTEQQLQSLPAPAQENYNQKITSVQGVLGDDPKRAAQVVKTWVEDGK